MVGSRRGWKNRVTTGTAGFVVLQLANSKKWKAVRTSNRKHSRTSYKKNSLIKQQNLRLSCIGEKLVCKNEMGVSSKDEHDTILL
jgi:hypothetical protein